MVRFTCDTIWFSHLGSQLPFCRGKIWEQSSSDHLSFQCGQCKLGSHSLRSPGSFGICLAPLPASGPFPAATHCRCCLRASCHLPCGQARSIQTAILGSPKLLLSLHTLVTFLASWIFRKCIRKTSRGLLSRGSFSLSSQRHLRTCFLGHSQPRVKSLPPQDALWGLQNSRFLGMPWPRCEEPDYKPNVHLISS